MAAKDPKKSEAALIRWDPAKRSDAVFERMRRLLIGYANDHGEVLFNKEEAYIILSLMGYRTARPTRFAREELGIDMDLEILP